MRHWISPLLLLAAAACGSESSSPIGAGGASASAASSGSGAPCITCDDALEHGKNGAQMVCAPESANWQAIIECACVGDCAFACSGTCEGGGVNVTCTACLEDATKGCPPKLAACKTP